MGTAATTKLFFVSAPATGPTTGGTLTVAYNDAASSTPVSFADGASTVAVIDNLNWGVSTGNGLAGGTYNLQVQATGLGSIGNTADLRLTLAAGVVGVAAVNGGTTAAPQINRTGLTAANLSNTFFCRLCEFGHQPVTRYIDLFYGNPCGRSGETGLGNGIRNGQFLLYHSAVERRRWLE